jgi:hypothetical protein
LKKEKIKRRTGLRSSRKEKTKKKGVKLSL